MAKAKNDKPAKRQRKTKVAAELLAAPKSAPDRSSVNEAFHLMLAQLQPHAARHRLDVALQAGEVRLWDNDTVVDLNFIATHLRVAARTEPDGRWIACIEPTKALERVEYIWTVSRAEVVNLLHREAPRSPVDLKSSSPDSSLDSCAWARAEVNRMKAEGYRFDARKTNLARELERRMNKAVKRGEIRKALTLHSIVNKMADWGVWPVDSTKI